MLFIIILLLLSSANAFTSLPSFRYRCHSLKSFDFGEFADADDLDLVPEPASLHDGTDLPPRLRMTEWEPLSVEAGEAVPLECEYR